MEPTAQTVAAGPTRVGLMVGTVAYMSPEQASGRTLDARSDIFSFGALLYELIAGRRPFTGATDVDLLHVIAHGSAEPLPSDVPAALQIVIEKALEKDPADRYQSMRELVVDLRRLARQSAETVALERPRRRSWTLAVGAAVVLIVALASMLIMRWLPQQPTASATLQYTPLTNFADSVVSPALSPDGRMLTFIRGDSTFIGPGEIYVKLLPDGEPVQLTRDGKQKMSPAFSPDGSRIAYTTNNESLSWDMWTIPVLGGQPHLLFANAEGLTWIPSGTGQSHVLFSELTGEGIHMVVTTATENRLDARRVYVPTDLNGMAHRSSLSPDGREVLVVEMLGAWLPCRLVPYDGSSWGRTVGPSSAPCTHASWSPDGRWMYFSANAGNGFHAWRQRFPDGRPEQITAGTTDEQGLAFAPDGRSFVTSIGTDQNTIWVHDSRGERQVTSQGYAYLPKFSPDGKRLYYMLRSGVSTRNWVSGELWVTDLESGQRERLLPDFLLEDYSVSPDGTSVVFTVSDDAGHLPVWMSALDKSSPPRRLADVEAARPLFGPSGDVFFVEEGFLQRIRQDGTGRRRVLPNRVRVVYSISADEKWAACWVGSSVVVAPLDGGPAIELCSTCGTVGAENRGITPTVVSWSRNGKFLYLHSAWTTRETYAVALQPGQILPSPRPARGLRSVDDLVALVGAQRIPQPRAFVGDDPSVYAFLRNTSQRNIYRIPVP